MAKLIQQIHDLINLAIDKGVTDYISPENIDNAIDAGQMTLFRLLVKDFAKNKRVRNDLLPFEKLANINIFTKVGSLPSDFEQEIEIFYTAAGVDYPVNVKESAFFRKAIRDVVSPPTVTDPIATINNNAGKKIEVYPQITPINLRYWILPPKPAYVTIISGGLLIYDETTSIDVLWSRGLHDILVENTFKILGLNLREVAIVQAGMKPFVKESTI